MTYDFTEGNITRKLLLFSVPLIIGNMLQQLYNIADTAIVGRYLGEQALAAVGTAYSLMTFLTSVFIGLCMGSGAYFFHAIRKTGYGAIKNVRVRGVCDNRASDACG